MEENGKKLTARNSKFLAKAKTTWNAKIYKNASQILNEDGEIAAICYLARFVHEDFRETRMVENARLLGCEKEIPWTDVFKKNQTLKQRKCLKK